MKKIYRLLAGLIILIYFVIGIWTLPQYGVNWDEASHLTRGQTYLYYFLTGKKQYDQAVFQEGHRSSFYQMIGFDFGYQMRRDGDHPVFSDVASSLFNYIFYQRLGILGDFEAYHFYGVTLVTAFLLFLFFWVERYYGGFAALTSILALTLYPLFYGESHFNVQKDIPEAVYLTAAALSFYTGFVQKSPRLMLATGILAGAALGTKLNVVFLPITIVLWIIIYGVRRFLLQIRAGSKKFHLAFLLIPIFAVGIYIASWPWLWQNPIQNILLSLGYYRSIGTTSSPIMPPGYYVGGLNTYALQWILFITPPGTLFLTLLGIWWVLRHSWKEKNKTSLFILFLFLVPIMRVSLPFTSIYGGVRQIMEYIPPMAILAGIGATSIVTWFVGYLVIWKRSLRKKKLLVTYCLQVIIMLSFLPITLKMIRMHPNESLYFNFLIGGFKGAAMRNIPGWGNSLGNVYRQGVKWINKHAEPEAKVAFGFELMSSIPRSEFRSDIKFSNLYRSGPKREGEYIIGVTHEGDATRYFNYRYSQHFLQPVYEVVIDGVPILKVWKNDEQHTKPEILREISSIKGIQTEVIGEKVIIEFPDEVQKLMNITISFIEEDCTLPENGQLLMSVDGQNWAQSFVGNLLETASYNWFKPHSEKGKLRYIFAADRVRYLKITGNDETSCLRKYPIRVEAEGIE